jgi:hypothetical protein
LDTDGETRFPLAVTRKSADKRRRRDTEDRISHVAGPMHSCTVCTSWEKWEALEVKAVVVLLLTISRRSVSFLLVVRRNESMANRPSDLVQGTLDMFILKTLALEPMYG